MGVKGILGIEARPYVGRMLLCRTANPHFSPHQRHDRYKPSYAGFSAKKSFGKDFPRKCHRGITQSLLSYASNALPLNESTVPRPYVCGLDLLPSNISHSSALALNPHPIPSSGPQLLLPLLCYPFLLQRSLLVSLPTLQQFQMPCFLAQHCLGFCGQACGSRLLDSIGGDEGGAFRGYDAIPRLGAKGFGSVSIC